MEDNPYQFIIQTLEVAEKILTEAEKPELSESERGNRFLALVLLERVIDKERIFVPPGSAAKYPEIKSQMEGRYNQFRSKLWDLGGKLKPDELKHDLTFLGDFIKNRFTT